MEKKDDYVLELFNRVKNIDDEVLKQLVYRIIFERNELVECITLDNLTGVYNRRILNQIKDYSAVVMCDVDDFKKINDTYGHDTGDKILKVVARTLTSHTRFDDIVCRYGGDEFIIVFIGCPLEVVYNRMQNIQNSLKDPFRNGSMSISLSVGIASRNNNQTLEESITEADTAMYKSKQLKNNNISSNNITIYNGEEIIKKLK